MNFQERKTRFYLNEFIRTDEQCSIYYYGNQSWQTSVFSRRSLLIHMSNSITDFYQTPFFSLFVSSDDWELIELTLERRISLFFSRSNSHNSYQCAHRMCLTNDVFSPFRARARAFFSFVRNITLFNKQ